MATTEQTQTAVPTTRCRTCYREAVAIGRNGIGRPVYKCPEGHTQAGPYP